MSHLHFVWFLGRQQLHTLQSLVWRGAAQCCTSECNPFSKLPRLRARYSTVSSALLCFSFVLLVVLCGALRFLSSISRHAAVFVDFVSPGWAVPRLTELCSGELARWWPIGFLGWPPSDSKAMPSYEELDWYIYMIYIWWIIYIIGLFDLARSLSFDLVWPQHHNISFLAFLAKRFQWTWQISWALAGRQWSRVLKTAGDGGFFTDINPIEISLAMSKAKNSPSGDVWVAWDTSLNILSI